LKPRWCAKLTPCDFDEKSSYCVHRECRVRQLAVMEDQRKALHLLDLIVAEFRSDPMSVQCFDLNAIVQPSHELVEKWNEEGRP
jgi:hypothetical protein